MHLVRGAERAGQCQPMFGQQSARGRVASQQLALIAQRQQVASVDQDELPRAVETEDRPVAIQAQEVGVLDHPRVLFDQLQGEGLRILGWRRMQRRDVQHRQQLPLGVEHRHRRAGEVGMPDAEVIVLMTRQRLLFLDAGADRAGAGVVLAPVRAQIQAGLAMRLLVRRIAEKLHGDAAVVGQQNHVAQLGHLPVELLHARTGHVDQLVCLVLVLAQNLPGHEARLGRTCRVQTVVVHTAAPGARNDRIAVSGKMRRVGQRQHRVDVAHGTGEQVHASSSKRSQRMATGASAKRFIVMKCTEG